MSSYSSQKLDKFGTRMSQISAKYATRLFTKSVTGAIDYMDNLAKGGTH